MHAQLVPFGAANFLNRAAWPVAPAAVLVLLLPGWLAMSVTMLGKIVPASLRPAVALVLTLALTALLTALQLAASAPLARTEQALALICVALVVVRAVQRRRSGAPIGPLGWARSCFSDVRAGWRDTHLVARIVAVIAVLCGWILGTKMGGDAIYHTAQAVKLGALAHPNFDNTLQYADGSAHPGYFVPVVQQLIALVAHAAHTSAANTMWMLPAIIAPIAALTAAGTLRVYLGTRQAEAFGARSLVWRAGAAMHALLVRHSSGVLPTRAGHRYRHSPGARERAHRALRCRASHPLAGACAARGGTGDGRDRARQLRLFRRPGRARLSRHLADRWREIP